MVPLKIEQSAKKIYNEAEDRTKSLKLARVN
jgi:hypothetical protein